MTTCEHCIFWETRDDICGRCGLSWEITPASAWCDEADDGEEDDDEGRESALPSAEAVSRKEKCCPIAETCMSIDCPVSSEYIGRPSAEAEWIPCSERLPDDDGDYLVWLEDESDHYAVVYFDTGADAFGWWVDHYDPITLGFIESDFCEAKNITAWQPLPTPYKGGDDE